jgi:hypothetical protein
MQKRKEPEPLKHEQKTDYKTAETCMFQEKN